MQSFHPTLQDLSLAKWMCHVGINKGSRQDYFSLRIQLWLLNVLDVYWYERCTWNRCHPLLWNGVEYRNYWAIFRPMTFEPITCKDQTFIPIMSTNTANRAGDFRLRVNLVLKMSQLLVSNIFFYYLRTCTSVLLILYCILVAVCSIFVFLRL